MKLKILERKTEETKEMSSWWRKILLVGLGLVACFFVVLSLVKSCAPPNQYVLPDSLSEPYTVLESAGGTYFGPIVDNVYSGNGEFQYLAGGTYEGTFQNNQREGKGTFYWDNGDAFSGTWSRDEMVSGTYTFADGRLYIGDFKDNAFQTGKFSLGEACSDYGFASFEVELENGEISSLHLQTLEGLSFEGESTGMATITYPSGDVYAGDVVNGVRSGEGTYTWKSGPSYVGTWANGTMSGKGTYHYTSKRFPCLKATFENNKPQGNAVYHKESGNTFDTVWKDGVCVSVEES